MTYTLPAGAVLWEAGVRTHPFQEQVVAAAVAGFDCVTVPPHVVGKDGPHGLTATQMRTFAADAGISISDLDGGLGFMPVAVSPSASERLVRRFGMPRQEVLQIGAELGVSRVVATGMFDPDTYGVAELVDGFGRLCDEVASMGASVTLEPLAFFGIANLPLAATIVREADRPNGAVTFDTWHFLRSGGDPATLPEVLDGLTVDVQLNDGAATPQGGSLMEDSVNHRRLPGDGEFDVVGILQQLWPVAVRSVGVEIFSAELDGWSADEVATRSAVALADVLDEAFGGELPWPEVGG